RFGVKPVSEEQKIFQKMVTDAGLPLTEATAKTRWDDVAASVQSPFNNNSEYSPFWRVVKALMTAPLLWIVNDLVLQHLLPNMFLKTASDVFLELFGWAVNLPRKAAQKAEGIVVFSRAIAAGPVQIPAGTIIQSPTINGKTYHL